jgi:DNA-binding MarR family transcriptional regulator
MNEAGSACNSAVELSNEFLSSARVFGTSVREVIERDVLREVSGGSLSFSQLKLLYLVAHTDILRIGDAAAFMGVTCAAASKAVDKLVRRRLLKRNAPQEDRRIIRLSLAEKGRELMKTYQTSRDYRAALVFSQFQPEEIRQAAELLDHLAGAIIGGSAEPDKICMQCEIYFREHCRYGAFGLRTCFYQRHQSQGRRTDRAGASEGKVD